MKNLLSIVVIITSFLCVNSALANNWQYQNNRIAISADGNNEPDNQHKWPRADPDDWGGTPVALALIAKYKQQKNLVHFSYNNFINAPAHTQETNQMKIGVDGAIKYWNFPKNRFFDVSVDAQAALDHLAAEIQKSTQNNPLYFLHMGPAEFFYRAVKQVIDAGHQESLKHVYVISHSGYNDNHLRRGDPKFDKQKVAEADKHHTMAQVIALSDERIHYKRIKDQNAKWDAHQLWNSEHNWQVWQWMKTHQDPSVKWLYQRMKQHPKKVADCSDAGLVYYLLTGDEDGSPSKLEALFKNGVLTN